MKINLNFSKKRALFAAIILCIVGYVVYSRHNANTADAAPAGVNVVAITLKPQNVALTVHVIGNLTARSVGISPETAGHISAVKFKDGASVAAGSVLFQLDDATYRARSESAQAQLIYSEKDYERKALLGTKGVVAKQAVDQAQATLKEKRASAEEASVALAKQTLVAPFAGRVSDAKVNPGDYVTVGQRLVTLTDTHHLHVEYSLPETYLPNLKIGQKVEVRSSAYPNQVFEGKLTYISPTLTASNRSIALYAEIPNDKDQLASGMLVDVMQNLGKNEALLLVPAKSLMPVLDGMQVYKIVDHRAYTADVVIGRRIGQNVQIVSGLKSGDTIVTDGQLKLTSGAAVKLNG